MVCITFLLELNLNLNFKLYFFVLILTEHSEQPSSDVLTPAPNIKQGEKRRVSYFFIVYIVCVYYITY